RAGRPRRSTRRVRRGPRFSGRCPSSRVRRSQPVSPPPRRFLLRRPRPRAWLRPPSGCSPRRPAAPGCRVRGKQRSELTRGHEVDVQPVLAAVARGLVVDGDGQRLVLRILDHVRSDLWRPQVGRQRLHHSTVSPERLVPRVALQQREDGLPRRTPAFDHLYELPERHQLLERALELLTGHFLVVGQYYRARLGRAL